MISAYEFCYRANIRYTSNYFMEAVINIVCIFWWIWVYASSVWEHSVV